MQEREFANFQIAPAGPGQPPQDVAQLIVAAGWAKVRDGVGEGEEAVRYVLPLTSCLNLNLTSAG
jgi:staphylococcal nuclease domain-containing protein 1